jgi:hypothetical protein
MQTNKERGNDVPQPAADSELEKYGVWVKAEPQEIVEEPEVAHEFLDAADISEAAAGSADDEPFSFDIPELDEEPSLSPPEDDLLIEEGPAPEGEPSLDTSLDADILEIETLESDSSFDSLETDLDEGIVEDGVIELPLDELDGFEALDETEGSRPLAGATASAAQPAGDAFETTELSLEDFGFDMDEPAAEESRAAPASAGGAEPETVDLSEFGLEDEADAAPETQDGAEDFENLDLDLHFDDTIPSAVEAEDSSFSLDEIADIGGEPLPGPELAMEDVTADFESMSLEPSTAEPPAEPSPRPAVRGGPSLDSFIDEDAGSEGIMPELGEESIRFDDVSAVERELGQAHARKDEGASAELLKAIAGELAAIKGELVSLRSQLVTLKAAQAAPEAEGPEGEEEGAEAPGGFFDEEEDDTIALTGDELDNILNTADFTEEAQPEEAPAGVETDLAGLDLLPEDGEYAVAAPLSEPAAEELGIESFGLDELGEAAEEAAPAEDLLSEFPEDIEIAPLTVIEDDTSYLEGDDDLSAFSEELSEPPLVEPAEEELLVDAEAPAEAPPEAAEELIVEADDELALEEGDEAALELELPDEEADELSLELPEDDELVLSLEGSDETELALDDLGAEILEEDEGLAELEDLPAEESEFDIELHAEGEGDELSSAFDDAEGELMELEEIEELTEPSPEFGDLDAIDDAVVSPSKPVELHPDELGSSLDESLFVGSDAVAEPEEADRVFDLSSPEDIKMPSFGSPEPEPEIEVQAPQPAPSAPPAPPAGQDKLKSDVKSVLLYLDQLLASLPEEKIEEFAASEYYDTYKKLFDELGLL